MSEDELMDLAITDFHAHFGHHEPTHCQKANLNGEDVIIVENSVKRAFYITSRKTLGPGEHMELLKVINLKGEE